MRHDNDLIIKEAEPKKTEGFKAFDMTLLRKAPCPLWLARPINIPRNEIRVCVAIDPTNDEESTRALSIEMLQIARFIADSCNGTLEIVSFWEYAYESYISRSGWIDTSSDEEIDENLQDAQTYHYIELNKLIKASQISGKQNIHHIRGKASELLGDFTKEKEIDIMVMGTVSRTGIAGFLIGNTAENIFEELTCSLLALKPHGFVSPIKPYDA
jgi:nucleotide-binding universal stress UspA family protein